MLGLFNGILDLIVADHPEAKFYSGSGAYTGTCDTSKYSSVFFYIDGAYYEVKPETFIFEYLPA